MAPHHEQTFTNGRVFTGRGETDFASAFTIRDGRFVWIGDAGEIDASNAIDLQGRTVLPGLLDIHCHPTHVARIVGSVPCTVPDVTSIPEMIEALKQHENVGKSEDHWIEGWCYDESRLAEQRTPTRYELDLVSATQPVMVMRSDFHSAICNSKALELAEITRDTPDPAGARIERDAQGEPTGFLIESPAVDLLRRVMGTPDRESIIGGIANVTHRYNERGIVGITDMVVPYASLEIYRAAEQQGLRQQAGLYVDWGDLVTNGIEELSEPDRTGRTRIVGVKLFADGTISGRTAWVTEPYPDSDEYGIDMLDEPTMLAAAEWSKRNGVQLSIHAMGDAALQQAIDVLGDMDPWLGDDLPSVRLEHISLLSEVQMRQMHDARMNFGATAQIIFFFAEHDAYSQNLHDAQYQRTYAVRSAYELIPLFGLSSDAPATTWADPDNVFVSIKAAATRKAYNGADIVPEQAITVPQAVLLYTARAAMTTPHEGQYGQIAEGFEGSFVVLDHDIFGIPAENIDQTSVAETWIAGEQVYKRS